MDTHDGSSSFSRYLHCAVRLSGGDGFVAGGNGVGTSWEIRDLNGAPVSNESLTNTRSSQRTYEVGKGGLRHPSETGAFRACLRGGSKTCGP